MNRTYPVRFIVFCLLLLAPLAARAEPLTDDTIRSFIDSMKTFQSMEGEFEGLTEELESQNNDMQMPDMSRIFSTSVEQMKGHEAHRRMEDVVQEHGFDSTDSWARAGDRIFHAWTSIEMGRHSGMMGEEMSQAMDQINNNPNMSEAQKEQMRKMMGGAMSAMEQASNAPEADKQAIRPYMHELRAVTKADQ
ncbi:hypothetical protein [Marinobacter sp. CHS3-4]|uniref:hypothetical protein n=1 Tax=Marinobacter sp. CHS3-4 TaxID=3045174 RepID=UPI0024B5B6C4|nr:hypothetical protein [Marinobacter sp. CHS3-4]MDI9243620.1 hypothetical protein [Marinobacter sp. CHS3-4]